MKRIGIALMAAVAIVLSMSPAHAGIRYNHFKTTPAAFSSVYPRDVRSHVDITFGKEGHLTKRFTDATTGDKMVREVYPTTVTGDKVRAIYVLASISTRHPEQKGWELATKTWCSPAPTDTNPDAISCSDTPPA